MTIESEPSHVPPDTAPRVRAVYVYKAHHSEEYMQKCLIMLFLVLYIMQGVLLFN